MRKTRPKDSPIIGWYRGVKILKEGYGIISIFDAPEPRYKTSDIITFEPWTDTKFEITDIVYIITMDDKIELEYTVKEYGEPHAREFYIRENEILPLPNKMKYGQ